MDHNKTIEYVIEYTIEYVIEYIKSKSEDWNFDLTNSFEYIDFIYELDKIKDALKLEKHNDCIDAFVNALIPRLTDAIYPKDVESMTNLINDVANELKVGGKK